MRRFRFLMAVALVGGSALGVVSAQGGEPEGGEVTVREPANLSAAEKLEASRAIVGRATRLSERVSNLLNEARRDADMIRITCLNDKLTQINAFLRNAEGRLESLANAQDQGLQDHEFTVIGVLGQKFTTLEQEANQCVGQEIYETGTSTNSTQIDSSQAGGEENAGQAPQPPAPVLVGSVPPPNSPIS